MALEDYSPDLDSSEGLGGSSESIREGVSEKFKEAVKKGAAGIKRVRKDEKKAKKYDYMLANFLVQIITDKKYDSLLSAIFSTMDYGYTSNFILGILSLINVDVSNKIRELTGKEKVDFSYISEQLIEFDDTHLPKEIKDRINYWIEDIIDSTIIDYSNIQAERNLHLLQKNSDVITNFTAQVFTFFLYDINIKISKNKALSITDYIIGQVKKSLSKIHLEKL